MVQAVPVFSQGHFIVGRMQDFLRNDSAFSSIPTAPSVSVTSVDLQMQQLSTLPGPQNFKQLDIHFQDQDSSSTQSTGQSCPEVSSEGERKNHGSSRSSGKAEDSKSVSSQEHGWTSNMSQKNFVCVSFPHPYPYHHGLVAAYGDQTMVQSQMLGTVSHRVPLPLDVQQDEPIFVNAKQYQAIMRRRQYRAKLEAQNKLTKGRKPYLHESRHRHALNRARGPGGRFLNIKKLQESKSPELINSQDTRVSDELQLNTKMSYDVHQPEFYKGSYSTPACSGITSGLNIDAVYHQQPFKLSAFSPHIGGALQQGKERKDHMSNPYLSSF